MKYRWLETELEVQLKEEVRLNALIAESFRKVKMV